MAVCVSPCLEGEGEWLWRPYCLSHSSLSFSRLSRSLNTEPLGQTVATHTYQTARSHTHTGSYFMRILRAMARSSPSRSFRKNTQPWGETQDNRVCFSLKTNTQTHTCRLLSCCWTFTCAALLSALAAGEGKYRMLKGAKNTFVIFIMWQIVQQILEMHWTIGHLSRLYDGQRIYPGLWPVSY